MTEKDYTHDQISTFLNGLTVINSTLGALDVLRMYAKQAYSSDAMLSNSLNKLTDDLIKLSGVKYNKIDTSICASEVKPEVYVRPVKPSLVKSDTNIPREKVMPVQDSSEHTFENSTNLHTSKFDPDFKMLTIKFRTGRTYVYQGVSQSTYDMLLAKDNNGESAGTYFNREIRAKVSASSTREITDNKSINEEEMVG